MHILLVATPCIMLAFSINLIWITSSAMLLYTLKAWPVQSICAVPLARLASSSYPFAQTFQLAHSNAAVVNVQGLSTDARPEVRNSGVRTLFSVVAGHGARLSPAAWDEVLWEILFPLMRSVHQMAATSSREEVQLVLIPWKL